MWYDIGMFLIIPAAIFAFWAQFSVNGAYKRFSKIQNGAGLTGADAARRILDAAGLSDVPVERVPGNLTDHYDPRARALRLSDGVYGQTTIAAVGIAAHETGHAIQHEEGYTPLSARNSILPVANIGSQAAFPLILIGMLIATGARGGFGMTLVNVGLILFSIVVAFQLITLPVELNASARALSLIESNAFLTEEENEGARKVLRAAAMTYVAAAAVAIANLLRLALMASGRGRRD